MLSSLQEAKPQVPAFGFLSSSYVSSENSGLDAPAGYSVFAAQIQALLNAQNVTDFKGFEGLEVAQIQDLAAQGFNLADLLANGNFNEGVVAWFASQGIAVDWPASSIGGVLPDGSLLMQADASSTAMSNDELALPSVAVPGQVLADSAQPDLVPVMGGQDEAAVSDAVASLVVQTDDLTATHLASTDSTSLLPSSLSVSESSENVQGQSLVLTPSGMLGAEVVAGTATTQRAQVALNSSELAELSPHISTQLVSGNANPAQVQSADKAVPSSSVVNMLVNPSAGARSNGGVLSLSGLKSNVGLLESGQTVAAAQASSLNASNAANVAGPTLNLAAQQLAQLVSREALAIEQQQQLNAEEQSADEPLLEGDFSGSVTSTTEKKASSPFLASISYPLRHPQWGPAVGKRIVFMANQQMQQAQIQLNPEKLGPIQVRLQFDRDQMVSVSMTAHHGTTREALELAIPKLKEMLAEAGINFETVLVQDERQFAEGGQSSHQDKLEKTSGDRGDSSNTTMAEVTEKTTSLETDNLVDYYA